MRDCSVDAVVTDPPYGLSFMGKKWDYDVPAVEVWAECLRVLKPGGHLLAFAGTRTQHRMAVRIEDAGFEIRDMIAWVYGSGFPKSMDASKAIDKAAGAEREVVGCRTKSGIGGSQTFAQDAWTQANRGAIELEITAPATDAARQWQGWGTALKPALEPITVARKPLDGTVAANLLKHGTGGLNIDGCRVAGVAPQVTQGGQRSSGGIMNANGGERGTLSQPHEDGRWPANLIHDGSEEVLAHFPETAASKSGGQAGSNANPMSWNELNPLRTREGHNDSGGSAARFFYCAKADKSDRDAGLEGFEKRQAGQIASKDGGGGGWSKDADKNPNLTRANVHPTVKPTDLMRYLCRLVTQPGGVVLDPFMGSGSTGKAAVLEGFNFIGIEREAEYLAIARARIEHAQLLKTAGAEKLVPASTRDAHTVDLFSEPAHP
jgi:site-specific DNA-methyltransferase (adenine-specific)